MESLEKLKSMLEQPCPEGEPFSLQDSSVALIKQFEGFSAKPYLDVASIPTIGYGTIKINGRAVTLQTQPCTEEQASAYLLDHVECIVMPALHQAKLTLTQNQGDALVSFIYNVGAGAFLKSTLLKKLKAGDIAGAANEFLKWNKAGGKEVSGLTRRRVAERSLFIS